MIYHNTIRFSETGWGLHISSSDSINISNNIVESNYDGLYVISSTNIIIAKNHFRTNGNQYSFGTLQLYNSRQNKIYSNNISKNKGYGLYLTFSRSEIINNNIIGNDYDAYFENTFFLRWQGNYWDEPHTFPKMIFGKIYNILAIQDSAHAHAVDNVALTQHNILAVADAIHARHSVDNVTVTYHAGVVLVVQDSSHGHIADSPALTQHNVLTVQDSYHFRWADGPISFGGFGGAVVTAVLMLRRGRIRVL